MGAHVLCNSVITLHLETILRIFKMVFTVFGPSSFLDREESEDTTAKFWFMAAEAGCKVASCEAAANLKSALCKECSRDWWTSTPHSVEAVLRKWLPGAHGSNQYCMQDGKLYKDYWHTLSDPADT